MFICLAILALSSSFSKIQLLEEIPPGDGSIVPSNPIDFKAIFRPIFENLRNLLGSGITGKTFKDSFKTDSYTKIIETLADKNKILINVSTNQGLISNNIKLSLTFKELKILTFFEDKADLFGGISTIIDELGPGIGKLLNVNFDPLNDLFKYITLNSKNGNDGVVLEKVLEKLKIPTYFVTNLNKIMSVFDNRQPISTLFDGFDVKNDYDKFVTKVEGLKIPEDLSLQFLSTNKILDTASSGVDVFTKAYENILKMYNDIITPLSSAYLLKPMDIIDSPIGERAKGLYEIIEKINSYSQDCSDEPTYKCIANQYVNKFSSSFACKQEEEACHKDSIPKVFRNYKAIYR